MTRAGVALAGALYFNRASGKGLVSPEALRARLEDHEIDLVEIGDGVDIVDDVRRRQGRGQRLFLAAGGDGTIHHVIQAVADTDSVLGIVPIGTFNHLARDLRLPEQWEDALTVALGGREIHVDVGKVNGLYFANNISLGLYPEVVERRERMRKRAGKWLAYPLALIAALRRLSGLAMTVEAPPHLEVVRTRVFFVSANPYNLSNPGVIAPRESLQGGKLAAYWLSEGAFGWRLFRALLRYAGGKGTKIDHLRRLQTDSLIVRSTRSRLRIGIDGELIELEPPLRISVARSSLLVKVPRGERSRPGC